MLCRYKTKNSILTKKHFILFIKYMFLQLLTFHRISAPYMYRNGSSFQEGSVSFILFFIIKSQQFPSARPAYPSVTSRVTSRHCRDHLEAQWLVNAETSEKLLRIKPWVWYS